MVDSGSLEKNSTFTPDVSTAAERLVYWTLHRIARSPASIGELTKAVAVFPEEMRPKDRAAILNPLLHRMVGRGYACSGSDPSGRGASDTYSITNKGLRQLETMVHARMSRGPNFPNASPFGGSAPGEESSPLERSRKRIQVTKELLRARGLEETPTQRESALRLYSLATERELRWTEQLLREKGFTPAGTRSRIR